MPQDPATPSAATVKSRDTGFTWAVMAKIYQFLARQEENLEQTFGHDLHCRLDLHAAHDRYEYGGAWVEPRELPGFTLTVFVLTDLPIDEQVRLRAKTDALWRSSLLREQDFTASITVRPRSALQTAQTGVVS